MNTPHPWTCEKCGATWVTRSPGDCHQCTERAGHAAKTLAISLDEATTLIAELLAETSAVAGGPNLSDARTRARGWLFEQAVRRRKAR